jgi:hypothetical protein
MNPMKQNSELDVSSSGLTPTDPDGIPTGSAARKPNIHCHRSIGDRKMRRLCHFPNRRIIVITLFLLIILNPLYLRGNDPERLNLNGKWRNREGALLQILHAGSRVTATYIEGGDCPWGESLDYYFDGQLNGNELSGPFRACGRKKVLIDCGAPKRYTSSFKATVNNNDEITGKRVTKGYYGYESGGVLTNCHEDSAYDGEEDIALTRICEEVQGRCGALQAARAAVGRLLAAYYATPGVQSWPGIVAANKESIIEKMRVARRKMCNDAAAQSTLDTLISEIQSLDASQASTAAEVVSQARHFASADIALGQFHTGNCTAPPEDPLETCPPETQEIDPETNEALDQVVSGINDAIKQLIDETAELDRNSERASNLWGKIDKLQKAKGFWEQIKAASCLPPGIAQWLRVYVEEARSRQDTTDTCNTLCRDTAAWIASMTGSSIHQWFSMESCLAACN